MHLSIARNIGPFYYDIPLADTEIFKALQKGAPNFPSKALRFNDWIKHLWQKSQELNCRFEAMMYVAWSLCFCESKDTFHRRMIPSAMAIAQGHIVPLAPLFLCLLCHELEEIHAIEEQVVGRVWCAPLLVDHHFALRRVDAARLKALWRPSWVHQLALFRRQCSPYFSLLQISTTPKCLRRVL